MKTKISSYDKSKGVIDLENEAHEVYRLLRDALARSLLVLAGQQQRIRDLESALDFYADPFEKESAYDEQMPIPNNYWEVGFGVTAKLAIEGKKYK